MTLFDKPFVFITGSPRSGTSLLTKVIDSHPDVAILMENIFGNRRRHWQRAEFWNSQESLKKEVEKAYEGIQTPIIGNKVVTPEVWEESDIAFFCRLFKTVRIVYIVRDPAAVALSRIRREPEDFFKVFTEEARKHLLIDFRSRFSAYVSSWRQSVESYWRLRDGFGEDVMLVYYEDFCRNFNSQIRRILAFLGIAFAPEVLTWHDKPHHDSEGKLVRDLKYPDAEVFCRFEGEEIPDDLNKALESILSPYALWRERKL